MTRGIYLMIWNIILVCDGIAVDMKTLIVQ